MIYLDNAATSVVNKDILESYHALLKDYYGNAASNHKYGQDGFRLLKMAREQIIKSFDLKNDFEVIFTSGATEANNLAIKGVAFSYKNRGKHLITTTIEHPSVINTFKQLRDEFGFEISFIDVDESGQIDLEQLKKTIRPDTILVSMMSVNNETGTILNLLAVKEVIKDYPKIFFHSDTTQGIGKINHDYNIFDLFVLSAHKLNGLKGSGALIKKKSINLVPLLCGGGQENGIRSGTNDVPKEVTLAKTIRIGLSLQNEHYEHAKELNAYTRKCLMDFDEIILNSPLEGSPFILNFSLTKHKASVVVEALSLKNIMVSTISACSSKRNESSHVLKAVGKDMNIASNPIRISFNHTNTIEEIQSFIEALKEILASIR